MEPIIEEFTITLKYQVKVDTETGEMTTKCISRKVDKSNFEVVENKPKRVKKEESSKPILTVEDNKYCLNTAAVELMGLESGCKLDIKYQKVNNKIIPVIADDEVWGTHSGNKMTKSFTIACRGSKREELVKYGTSFEVTTHPETVGLFILKSNDITEDNIEDDIEEISLPIDDDFQKLIDDEQITEINPSIFKF